MIYAESMADFIRHLPLSAHAPADESGVTSDRKAQLAAVLNEAARLILLEDAALRTQRANEFIAVARLAPDDGGEGLNRVADAVQHGRRRNMRDLAYAVRALLKLAGAVGVEPEIDSRTAGSVALWAAANTSFERRAVVRGHTLRADDADWSFGEGPTLGGRSIDIVAFLLKESEKPPSARGSSAQSQPKKEEA